VVVDDHALFVRGLVRLLAEHVKVVGTAGSGEEALELVEALRPEVVLMDLGLPGMSGVEATRRLTDAYPDLAIVVLTVMADEETLMDALLAGAAGYQLKSASVEDIVAGIDAATTGGSVVAPEVMGKLVRSLRRRHAPASAPRPQLTEREREVLDLLADGHDNAEIARRLYISQNTVKNHVAAILAKLGVSNRLQAALQAVRGWR
jgi:DNA-binding NarL/FixJ family response regulator